MGPTGATDGTGVEAGHKDGHMTGNGAGDGAGMMLVWDWCSTWELR